MLRKLFPWFHNQTPGQNRTLNSQQLMQAIDFARLPNHIAIIMDGNGRWAQKRGMPRMMGHRAGVESLRDVVKVCNEIKIPVLTVYAFSTENWKRPKDEVDALMKLLVEYVYKEIDELDQNKVQIRAIGRIHKLPEDCRRAVAHARERTADNDGLIFNLALNYGGRSEIVDTVRTIIKKVNEGELVAEEVDEQLFAAHLYTAGLPDPDLLIRPSGDYRISNFLLWQLAYTEFWHSDVMWPDFRRKDLLQAIYDYQCRERRFGGLLRRNKK
ncbi:isoprenyl transferase [Peptococcaceae bacterium 1198_IL3148]